MIIEVSKSFPLMDLARRAAVPYDFFLRASEALVEMGCLAHLERVVETVKPRNTQELAFLHLLFVDPIADNLRDTIFDIENRIGDRHDDIRMAGIGYERGGGGVQLLRSVRGEPIND